MLHAMKCSHGAIYCAKQSIKRAIVLPSQNVCAKPGKTLHDYSHDASKLHAVLKFRQKWLNLCIKSLHALLTSYLIIYSGTLYSLNKDID
jgi:hypothetical protein